MPRPAEEWLMLKFPNLDARQKKTLQMLRFAEDGLLIKLSNLDSISWYNVSQPKSFNAEAYRDLPRDSRCPNSQIWMLYNRLQMPTCRDSPKVVDKSKSCHQPK